MGPDKEAEAAKSGTFGVIVVVVALLAILLAALLWRWPHAWAPGLRQATDVAEQPGPQADAAMKTGTGSKSRTGRTHSTQRATPLSLPTAESIPTGLAKSKLLEQFGNPNMITTSVEQGQVVETLVYIRRNQPTIETVVRLKNGAVVSATSNTR